MEIHRSYYYYQKKRDDGDVKESIRTVAQCGDGSGRYSKGLGGK